MKTQLSAPRQQKCPERGALQIRDWRHKWGTRTLLMGIVNVTPDSFSQDGLMEAQAALEFASRQIDSGADILDLGAESTRPGYSPVSVQEELRRAIPLISALRKRHPDAIISIDTSKAEVLRQAVENGADILNSVLGLSDDLLAVASEHRLPVVIMHNQEKPEYEDGVVDELIRYFDSQVKKALSVGLAPEMIVLDPGIGFAKTAEQNVELLSQLHRIVALGFPTMIGSSRKSFIGILTGKPVSEREFGTAATVALAVQQGVDIVRVHNVGAMKDVINVADAIVYGKNC